MEEIGEKIIFDKAEFERGSHRRIILYAVLVLLTFIIGYYCGNVFESKKHYQKGYDQAIDHVEKHFENPTPPINPQLSTPVIRMVSYSYLFTQL
jgi:hypothetical protein